MSDFTLTPPILAAILGNAPPSGFSAPPPPPPPDNYCTVPKFIYFLLCPQLVEGFFSFG